MDSSTRDRIEGGLDSVKGHAKSGIGDATGDDRTRAEGEGDKLSGDAKQTMADVKDLAGDLKNKAGDALNDRRNR